MTETQISAAVPVKNTAGSFRIGTTDPQPVCTRPIILRSKVRSDRAFTGICFIQKGTSEKTAAAAVDNILWRCHRSLLW